MYLLTSGVFACQNCPFSSKIFFRENEFKNEVKINVGLEHKFGLKYNYYFDRFFNKEFLKMIVGSTGVPYFKHRITCKERHVCRLCTCQDNPT